MSARRSEERINTEARCLRFSWPKRRTQRAFSLVLVAIRKPEYAILNKLINKHDYGWLVEGKGVIRPKKERWLAAMAASPKERFRHVYPLNNRDLLDHEQGRDTFYYTPRTSGQGLWGIDIDCHGCGTADGAEQARALVAQWFPGIYTETSGGGIGAHGHVIVDYGDFWAEDIKPLWKSLCVALDQKCRSQGINIEKIEAKGLPSVVIVEKREISPNSKMGTLIRLPRNIKAAMGTCRVTPDEIIRITDEIKALLPATNPPTAITASTACSNCLCERDDIDRLEGFARKLLYGYNSQIVLSNRVRVTVEDVAVALWITNFCKKKHNSAGHTPGNRIKALWNLLREQGVTDRAFDPKRWAWIRNMLSDYGYIDWQDATYSPGKAMEWEITDQLESVLDGLMHSLSTGEEQAFSLPRQIHGQRPINRWNMTLNWADYAARLEEIGLGTLSLAV